MMIRSIILTVLFIFSLSANAASQITFGKYNSQNIKTEFKSAFSDLQKFSEIEKLNSNDLSLVVSALETWILVDTQDNARSAAQILAGSYDKNKKIYKQAFQKLKKDQKKKIQELFEILEQLNQSAQG